MNVNKETLPTACYIIFTNYPGWLLLTQRSSPDNLCCQVNTEIVESGVRAGPETTTIYFKT